MERAFAVWFIAVCVSYVGLVIQQVTMTINAGEDRQWALLVVACALISLVAHVVAPRRLTTLILLLPLVVCAASMVVFSGQLAAAMLSAWLFVLAFLFGSVLLRVLGAAGARGFERVVLATSLGLIGLALVALTLAATSTLTFSWTASTLGCLTIALVVAELRHVSITWPLATTRALTPVECALAPLLAVATLMALTWALVPEIQYDALNYHLAVPRDFLAAGHIVDLPHYWHSYFAQMTEMIYAVGLALHGPGVPKLMVLGIAVLAGCTTFILGSRLFSSSVAWCGTVVFLTTPIVVRLATTADVDLAVALMLLGMGVCLMRWTDKDRQPGWLYSAALFAGAAIGVKVTALYGLVVVGPAVLWRLARSASSLIHAARQAATVLLLVAGTAGPWYFVRYWLTGNPVFPFFEPDHPTVGGAARYLHSSVTAAEVVSRAMTDPVGSLILPIRVMYQSSRFGAHPDGSVGATLLALPFAMMLVYRTRPFSRLLVAITVAFLVCWSLGFPHARLFVPVLPLAALLCAAGTCSAFRAHGPAGTVVLFVVATAQLALVPSQFWHIPERLPIAAAFDRESEQQFLERSIQPYAAVAFLNSRALDGERIIGAGVDGIRYYLRAPLSSWSETRALRLMTQPLSTEGVARLVADNYTYVLVNHDDGGGAAARDSFRNAAFLDRFTRPVFSHRNVTVYRLLGQLQEPAPTVNVINNAGFDLLSPDGGPVGWQTFGAPRVRAPETPAPSGALAARCDATNLLIQRVSATAGALYSLSQFVWSEASLRDARLQINWLDAHGAIIDASIKVVEADDQWRQHRAYATAPGGTTMAEIFVGSHGASAVWFDDVAFGILEGSEADVSSPAAR